MNRIIKAIALSFTIPCFLCNSLSAQPETDTAGSTTTGETIAKELPKALTLGVVDGIVRYINNDRRIKIRLSWEPLAVTDSLISQSTKYNFTVSKLKIKNEDINSGAWQRNLSPSEKDTLINALNVADLEQLKTPISSVDPFLGDALKVSEYIQMQRERNILIALLKSKGGEYSFGLKADERSIVPPNFTSENIDWHIEIYSFKNSNEKEYYRFTAKAVIEPFEVSLTDKGIDISQKKVFYDARFKLKESKYLATIANNLFVNLGDINVPNADTDTVPKNLPKSEDINKSLTSLSGFLSIIGGSEQLGVLTQGLLGGTEDTSIISGGLIQNGGVAPLVGVNREVFRLGDDTSGGLLLGLGLGEKTSLFVGPSIQSSIFTISAGANIGTQNTDVNFAGMIAVDLSRLTNSKKNSSTIPVNISATGGGLGQASERITNKYTFLQYQVSQTFSLTRVCDEESKKISEENKNLRNLVNLQPNKPLKRVYLPRGVYRYTSTTGKKAYQQLVEDKLYKFEPDLNQDEDESIACDQ